MCMDLFYIPGSKILSMLQYHDNQGIAHLSLALPWHAITPVKFKLWQRYSKTMQNSWYNTNAN